MKHILRFMRTWQRNRIQSILSPRGLALALASNGGVKNSAVQLLRVDPQRLRQLRRRVASASQDMKHRFPLCHDLEFEQVAHQDDHASHITMEHFEQAAVEMIMKVSLYSGIDSTRFRVTLAAAPSPCPSGSRKEPHQPESLSGGDEAGTEDAAENGDVRRSGTAQEPEKARHDFSGEVEKNALVVDVGDDDSDEDADHPSDTGEDDDVDNVWVAPHLSYAPTDEDGSRHMTLVHIVNSSSIDVRSWTMASQPKNRSTHVIAPNDHARLRKDAVAVAVRFTSHLIEKNVVTVRCATEDAPEYAEARQQTLSPRPVGWARFPEQGATLGASFMHLYEREVKELFNAAVVTPSPIRGPALMREELKRRHPGVFSIPSIAALRTKMNELSKTSTEDCRTVIEVAARSDMRRSRRGRPSLLPDELVEFLDFAIQHDDSIRTGRLLRVARERFPNMDDAVTDTRVKAKISAIKVARKRAAIRS